MILRYLPLLLSAPDAFAILLSAFVFSILVGLIFHEYCHAVVANWLGDPTAKMLGRLTLNPLAHYDPIGTTMIFLAGFGWAKPVPVNQYNTSNPKRSLLLISLAGPASNLVVAALAGLPIRLGLVPFNSLFGGGRLDPTDPIALLGLFLGTVLFLNVILGVFNLLPIPPLDGSKGLMGLLPDPLARQYQRLEPWGMGLLMLLVLLPLLTSSAFSLFSVIGPVVALLVRVFSGEAVAFG